MIREDIMERLVCFSDEEINNLNGFVGIDKSIFISEQSNVVDADKLLKANQQFAVRKHARFCEYPKHRHNYLEFMYVYGGEMVRFLYKGIIIKHNKTEPTYTKTSLFLCEKRRFFMGRTEKGGKVF